MEIEVITNNTNTDTTIPVSAAVDVVEGRSNRVLQLYSEIIAARGANTLLPIATVFDLAAQCKELSFEQKKAREIVQGDPVQKARIVAIFDRLFKEVHRIGVEELTAAQNEMMAKLQEARELSDTLLVKLQVSNLANIAEISNGLIKLSQKLRSKSL